MGLFLQKKDWKCLFFEVILMYRKRTMRIGWKQKYEVLLNNTLQ